MEDIADVVPYNRLQFGILEAYSLYLIGGFYDWDIADMRSPKIDESDLFPCNSASLLKRTSLYSRHCLHTSSDYGRRLFSIVERRRLVTLFLPPPSTPMSQHQILWRERKKCTTNDLHILMLIPFGIQGGWKSRLLLWPVPCLGQFC